MVVAFWIFLAAVSVASVTFVTIVVWAGKRLEERQEYYRFEFRKRLVEDGKMDAAALSSLMQDEHELGLRQGRERLLVAGLVFLGTGVGACIGLQFIGNSIWMLGFIPVSIGVSMLAYAFLFAAKAKPGSPTSR